MTSSKPRLPIKGMTREQHTMAVYTLWHGQLWKALTPAQRVQLMHDFAAVMKFLPATVESVKAVRNLLDADKIGGDLLCSRSVSEWVHRNRNEIIRIVTLGE